MIIKYLICLAAVWIDVDKHYKINRKQPQNEIKRIFVCIISFFLFREIIRLDPNGREYSSHCQQLDIYFIEITLFHQYDLSIYYVCWYEDLKHRTFLMRFGWTVTSRLCQTAASTLQFSYGSSNENSLNLIRVLHRFWYFI